jgi:hypothetical protein
MSEYEPRMKRHNRRLRHRSSKSGGFLDGREKQPLSKLWGRGRDILSMPAEDRQLPTCPESCRRR